MRLTENKIRKIVRESLKRRFLNEAEGSDSNRDLLAALYWISSGGRGGEIFIGSELTYKNARGVDQRFNDVTEYPFGLFLDRYIKPEKKESFRQAFEGLTAESEPSYVDVTEDDFVQGMGAGNSRFSIKKRDADGKPDVLEDVSMLTPEQTAEVIGKIVELNNRPVFVRDANENVIYDSRDGEESLKVSAARDLIPATPPPVEKPFAPGAKQTASGEDQEWLESVIAKPLRQGSTGDVVKRAQSLLVEALKEAASRNLDLPSDGKGPSVLRSLQDMAKNKKIDGTDVKSMIQSLAEKIEASGPDGKFGPMTKLATEIVQVLARGIGVDGVIGKDTGSALVTGFKRPTKAQQGEKKMGEMLEERAKRWARLAGIL